MNDRDDPHDVARALCRELDAARVRLALLREGSKGGRVAINAFALSKSIERLCREALLCADRRKANDLLSNARTQLDKLQTLLGTH